MALGGNAQDKAEWSTGEIAERSIKERVCLAFMEHLRRYATENTDHWGCKSGQVVAFGKLGCCCKTFTEFMKDPAVVRKFDYELEVMLTEWL